MKIKNGTRMIQTRADMRKKVYTVYNNRLEQEIQIDKRGAEILRKIHSGNYVNNRKDYRFLSQLKELGFVDDDGEKNTESIYLGEACSYKYPLTALSIELERACNLNCRHCYGKYSDNKMTDYITFEQIRAISSELDVLHTKKIALTGGEATLHPDFVNIVIFFLKKGFDLTILTNGYNCSVIRNLLEASRDYHYTIKVSLDGVNDVHDLIRGRQGAFSNAEETIRSILQCPNVTLYISTVIMKQNIDSIMGIRDYVKHKFPSAFHTFDFVFPAGNATSESTFTISEMEKIMKTYPELFSGYQNSGEGKDKFRCTGGITQCTLSYNGSLKICNSADKDIFRFSNNVFEKGLAYSWIHCGANIKRFRSERSRETKDCKKCSNVRICTGKDCRVMALAYLGDIYRSNPITCCTTELLSHRKCMDD